MMIDILSSIGELLQAPWVWLILLASVLYAAGNYLDELLLSKYEQEVGTLVIISTLFGAIIAAVFFGLAYILDVTLLLEAPVLIKALFVGVLEALWVIPYLYATERSGAIVAGPLFQAVPVFALFFEYLLGSVPPLMQMLGAAIIVIGGIVISIEQEAGEDGESSMVINWTTIFMMSISAILVSLIYVLFRDAALESSFLATGFWTGTGIFITGILIYVIWEPYRLQFNDFCKHANYKAVLVQFFNEILDASGVYMTNLANTLGPSVMVVTAFNASQPVAVGIIGFLLSYFGYASVSSDRVGGAVWLLLVGGILLIAIGIVVLALGGYDG